MFLNVHHILTLHPPTPREQTVKLRIWDKLKIFDTRTINVKLDYFHFYLILYFFFSVDIRLQTRHIFQTLYTNYDTNNFFNYRYSRGSCIIRDLFTNDLNLDFVRTSLDVSPLRNFSTSLTEHGKRLKGSTVKNDPEVTNNDNMDTRNPSTGVSTHTHVRVRNSTFQSDLLNW